MKGKRILTGVLLIVVALVLVGAVGLVLAQEPGVENDDVLPQGEPGTAGILNAAIPIQGRLTDAAGNPLTGSYSVVFTLYDASSGGNVLCTDTDTVNTVNGLFNASMHNCTASDLNGRSVWLGVKVGADAEMTPRQPISAVPYAWGLRPGAVISESLTSAIIHAENTNPSGRGLRGYATSHTGENFGVVGASLSPDGYGGYFYNNGGGIGLYGASGGAGLAGPAVHANATGSSGIALRADNKSTDATIVASNVGSGALFKGFGAGGGEDEIRINNDGSIETKADSYIFVPGTEATINGTTSGVELLYYGMGSVRVDPSSAGTKIIQFGVTLPSVLYGQPVKVEQVTVFYYTSNSASYIDATKVMRQKVATYDYYTLVNDTANRNSTAYTNYSVTPTAYNTLSSSEGFLAVELTLHFAGAGDTITIGGVRVRLGHHDLY